MAVEKFDQNRIGTVTAPNRCEYSYQTENSLWHVTCKTEQLEEGLFRDGEVWKSRIVPTFGVVDHKEVETGTRFRWKKIAAWNFRKETREEVYFDYGDHLLPQYVIDICQELSRLMADKYPQRGVGVGAPVAGGIFPPGKRISERDKR